MWEALLLMMVAPSFPPVHHRWLVRIAHLGLELAPEPPGQRGFPTRTSIGLTRLVVNLFDHLLHVGALPLELVDPRPHAIHVQPQHLILPNGRPPRAATAILHACLHRHISLFLLILVLFRLQFSSQHRGPTGVLRRSLAGDQSPGNGVTELKLLEEQHLHDGA